MNFTNTIVDYYHNIVMIKHVKFYQGRTLGVQTAQWS